MMLKLNATLHEAIVIGEQQGSQVQVEQSKPSNAGSTKGNGTSSVTALFKEMSQVLYLWMD